MAHPVRSGRGSRRLRASFSPPLLAAAAALLVGDVAAQEVAALGGVVSARDLDNRTYGWALDYQHNFGGYIALGAGWVNEGHAENHHRDGALMQLRLRASVLDPRLTVTAGIGPLYYFNTTRIHADAPDSVDHGWGVIYSLAATWELGRSWFAQARVQHTDTGTFDTTALFVGGGYRFGAADSAAGSIEASGGAPLNELVVFAGRTIANTFESEAATAWAIEYRRRIVAPLEWTITGLYEGDTGPVRRGGVASQLWGSLSFADDRGTIAVGLGPYIIIDASSRDASSNMRKDDLAGIGSISLAYRPTPAWSARFTWSRVFAEKSRDTDVLLLGIGYRF
jgi:hypothetical protein